MTITQQSKRNKKNVFKNVILTALSIGVGIVLFSVGKQQGRTANRMVRAESKPPTVSTNQETTSLASDSDASVVVSTEENWRGAPSGDGEDTLDSYHSYDHRPTGADPRDALLLQYTVHRCPNNGIGTMVSGQDPRYFEIAPPGNNLFKERNPKFVCDVAKLPNDPHQPCVVYSFGSWDEISFEVG